MDKDFSSIGGLTSNGFADYTFNTLYVRPLYVGDLVPIYAAIKMNSLRNLVHILDFCINENVYDLTDGDLLCAMAWIKIKSYPDQETIVRWTCKEKVIRNHRNHVVFDRPDLFRRDGYYLKDRGLRIEKCGGDNTIPLPPAKTKMVVLRDLQQDKHFMLPRVRTLIEYDEEYEGTPLAEYAWLARYIKAGTTLAEKIDLLRKLVKLNGLPFLDRVKKFAEQAYHGTEEVIVLDCRHCDTKRTIQRPHNFMRVFSVTSEESILNMQYNLSHAINIQTDDDTPSKRLLYWHSCYEKDRIQKEEQKQKAEAQKNLQHGRKNFRK